MTRQAFLDQKVGVLQLLTPSMQTVVPVLGKRSGYEQGYSKRDECHKLGHTWIHDDKQWRAVDSDIPTQNEVRYVLLRTSESHNDVFNVCSRERIIITVLQVDLDDSQTHASFTFH